MYWALQSSKGEGKKKEKKKEHSFGQKLVTNDSAESPQRKQQTNGFCQQEAKALKLKPRCSWCSQGLLESPELHLSVLEILNFGRQGDALS